MRPAHWEPPVELSASEQVIIKRIRRAKLFIFLREHRHEVFDGAFQEELAKLYQDSPRGQPPVAPALLALATILQAYTGASDDEVIEASLMDRRWQLVLDCLDTEEAPFSKGTLVAFRQRLISSSLVREREASLVIYCKAWPVRNRTGFAKTSFTLDWEQQTICCPNQQELPFEPGATVHFPAELCAACPWRDRCTSSPHGRSVSIHPDEALLGELRQRQLTPAGRTKLRERVAVEHSLAHVGYSQGRRARYRGERKNLFDLRRCAVVHNLPVLARLQALSHAA